MVIMTTPEIEDVIAEIRATLELARCLDERADRLLAEAEAAAGMTLAPVLTLVKG